MILDVKCGNRFRNAFPTFHFAELMLSPYLHTLRRLPHVLLTFFLINGMSKILKNYSICAARAHISILREGQGTGSQYRNGGAVCSGRVALKLRNRCSTYAVIFTPSLNREIVSICRADTAEEPCKHDVCRVLSLIFLQG